MNELEGMLMFVYLQWSIAIAYVNNATHKNHVFKAKTPQAFLRRAERKRNTPEVFSEQ